jgi:putative ABC transport system permease protein
MHKSLVIAQIAVSLVLLVCAGLFIKSLQNARSNNHGFKPDNLLIATVDVGMQGYDESHGRVFYKQLLERVAGLPGVAAASYAQMVPLGGDTQQIGVAVEGYEPPKKTKMSIDFNTVAPRYFETMGIPIVQGREFGREDRADGPGVIIVNEAFARRFWPDQNPLGKRVSVAGLKGPFLEVVGVAKNSKYNNIRESPLPFLYLPVEQHYVSGLTLHVRTVNNPADTMPGIRREVQTLDPDLPLFRLRTMNEHMGVALIEQRMSALLLGIFGLLALILASVGLYGVMAYSVSQRTRELGIRMALGANPGGILKLILKQGLRLTLIGLTIGLAGSFALTRFLASQLYNVSATDLITFALASSVLTVVALLASFIPAWRAARVDPLVALRYQ